MSEDEETQTPQSVVWTQSGDGWEITVFSLGWIHACGVIRGDEELERFNETMQAAVRNSLEAQEPTP